MVVFDLMFETVQSRPLTEEQPLQLMNFQLPFQAGAVKVVLAPRGRFRLKLV
jgi:hypothetical protein